MGLEGFTITGIAFPVSAAFVPPVPPTVPAAGTLFERGDSLLRRGLQQGATRSQVTIVYQRINGGVVAQEIPVTGVIWAGQTRFSRRDKEHGPAIVFSDADYLVPVQDLPWKPQRGDRVKETPVGGGVSVTYEVMAPPGEPEVRHSYPGRKLWRIHCKEVT